MRLLLLVLLTALAGCEPSAEGPIAPPTLYVAEDVLTHDEPAIRYHVALRYPQLRPATIGRAEEVNADIRRRVEALAASVRPDTTDLEPELREADGSLPFWVTGTAEGGFETTLANERVFSALLVGSVYTGGAHPNMVALPMVYDVETGREIALRSLFRPESEWLEHLAARATERLAAERGGTDWMFEGRVPADEDAFAAFTLTPDSLRVLFVPYAIAPYAVGPSTVAFSYEELRPWLAGEGLAATLGTP